MNKKIITIGLSIVGSFLLLGVIVYFSLRGGSEQTLVDENGQEFPFLGSLPQSGNTDTVAVEDNKPNLNGVDIGDVNYGDQVIASDLKKRSENFIERLGSYSSDSNLSNFDDVLPQTSADLELILRSMKQARVSEFNSSESFVGYTVTSVTSEANILDIDSGEANVIINGIRSISGVGDDSLTENNEVYIISWILGEDREWRINGVSGDF